MPGYSVGSLKFSVADLKADDLKKAADMRFKDYEDAIQSACATRIKANYIVKHIRIDFNFRNELAYYKEILQPKEVS